MAHSIDFMKTGCTSKISQISEFQNHLPKKSDFHISELIKKKTVCHDWPCRSWADEKEMCWQQCSKETIDNSLGRGIITGVIRPLPAKYKIHKDMTWPRDPKDEEHILTFKSIAQTQKSSRSRLSCKRGEGNF